MTDDEAAAACGVERAQTLLAFADAAVKGSDEDLGRARAKLRDELGQEPLVDAAAVVSNFERMVRIADSTGIPLDKPLNAMSGDLRGELGIDAFGSSANTPRTGRLGRALGPLLGPLALLAFRLVGPRAARKR